MGYGPDKKKPRRIMRNFRIDELASVDVPAQEGARAVLLKRAGAPGSPRVGKNGWGEECPAVMTSSVEGHAHLVYLRGRAGETSWQTSEGAESGHSHPWMLLPDGSVSVGESEGHSHDVDESLVVAALLAQKGAGGGVPFKPKPKPKGSKEDDDMAGKTDTEKALETQVTDLTARLARAETLAGLPAAERSHYEGLDAAGREAFLGKSADGRAAEVAAAVAADPVVYKTDAGIEFRKSDDPRLVAFAKQADEDRRARVAAEKKAETASYLKRAVEELPHLPGTPEVRAELLRAAEGIADEEARKGAVAALVAQNAAMAKAFEERGTAAGGGAAREGSPEADLEKAVAAYAKEHKVSEAVAYSKVLDTPEGRALYAKSVEGQPTH